MFGFFSQSFVSSILLTAAIFTTAESKVDDHTVTTYTPVQEYNMTIFSIPPQGLGEVTAEEVISAASEAAVAEAPGSEDNASEDAGAEDAPAAGAEDALQPDDSEIVFKRGDLGVEIRDLQHRLVELGYLYTGIDGDYGNQTAAAVMQFQEDNGFEATGDLTKTQYDLLFPEEASEEAAASDETEAAAQDAPADAAAAELKHDDSAIVAKPGDKGALVYKIQQMLALIHYPCISDGDYGSSTAEAVKDFQADNGYERTGELTQNQYDILFPDEAKAGGRAVADRIASAEGEAQQSASDESDDGIVSLYGDKGALVYKIQQRLVTLGYLNAPVDGDFGDLTLNAVKSFQEDNGFETTGRLTISQFEILFPGESGAAAVESEKPIDSYVSESTDEP